MFETLIQIIELLLIPVLILIVVTIAEQKIEPITYHFRFIKTSWDTQIFAIGAQSGFIFREWIHGTPDRVSLAFLYLLAIMACAAYLGKMRLELHHSRKFPSEDDVFHAGWLAMLSICIPIQYLLLLNHA